jgi:hypothetical protein
MTEAEADEEIVLDDIEINGYEVPVELILDEYGTVDDVVSDIETTTVNAILGHVDAYHLDGEEARSHIQSWIEFNEDHVEEEFVSGEVDVITVETVTQLGQATESAS